MPRSEVLSLNSEGSYGRFISCGGSSVMKALEVGGVVESRSGVAGVEGVCKLTVEYKLETSLVGSKLGGLLNGLVL